MRAWKHTPLTLIGPILSKVANAIVSRETVKKYLVKVQVLDALGLRVLEA